jgi:hypothetical protein
MLRTEGPCVEQPWKLLQEKHCGWRVPVTVDGIATALDDATRRSPQELVAMGARGRVVVAERLSWDKIRLRTLRRDKSPRRWSLVMSGCWGAERCPVASFYLSAVAYRLWRDKLLIFDWEEKEVARPR